MNGPSIPKKENENVKNDVVYLNCFNCEKNIPSVILGQYLGLAKLNSLNFIHLNIFEGEYLVTFRFLESKPILSFSGCNQSPPVIQYNVIIK